MRRDAQWRGWARPGRRRLRSLVGDLRFLAQQLAANLTKDGPALVKALLGWPDPEVQAHLASFWRDRQSDVAHVLARHHSNADPATITRLLAGPLHYQALIEGTTPDTTTVDNAATAALAGDAYVSTPASAAWRT